ncbi:uncharacterized protein LOC120264500 [Dioscorea cayenensis subsp. rotundata]|uniref:Uncharacterized protein LOC120264500 n=1 Tax=Dioscorea cayennensis subsp. rotundata TaxID=55577 RepID=A0AB40BMR2_DIOCR|nr:uncharacterized protein LOC120264500 [Dioscorea cayenensis subsp. rotundata]
MQTSSSRREATPEYRHKPPVGCISGILRLLSGRHSRKRLTSASKKDKITGPSPVKPSPEPVKEVEKKGSEHTLMPEKKTLAMLAIGEPRRRSCETPRSPTITPEIRRSSADSPRRSSALVARLMGLDDAPTSFPESAAEKRRKLLGALERCDEDLKALKRIIETVQLAELRTKQINTVGSLDERGQVKVRCRLDCGDLTVKAGSKDINGEQPSPVSVLDVITSPRFRANKSDKSIGSRTQETSPLGVFSQPGDSEKSSSG